MWYDEITSLASENVGNWEKEERFRFGLGRLENICNPKTQVIICYETWTSPHYDEKSTLDEANEASILEELEPYMTGKKPLIEEYAVRNENVLIVTALDENGDETSAWKAVVEIAESLSNYPVLDEDLYSQLESEKADKVIEGIMNDTFEIDVLREGLYEGLSQYGPEDFCESKVIEAGLESWYDELSGSTVIRIVKIVQENDPELLYDTISNGDKLEFLKNSVQELNRFELEELQELIREQMQLKVVK